jgi:hypothetical protein
MSSSAPRHSAVENDSPSLDPAAIEHAYLRERARRRVRAERWNDSRSSNARFWLLLAALIFLTVFLALTTWHEIQTTFGV